MSSEGPASPGSTSSAPLFATVAAMIVGSIVVTYFVVKEDTPPPRAESSATALGPAPPRPPAPRAESSARALPAASGDGAPSSAAPAPDRAGEFRLFQRPAPPLIEESYERIVKQGKRLHSSKTKELYDYGKAHPEDARPQLLLAYDEMGRKWHGFALGHYLKAFRADPESSGDPRMLDDLVTLAGLKSEQHKATDALREIYGSNAAAALSDKIDELMASGRPEPAERYREVLGAL